MAVLKLLIHQIIEKILILNYSIIFTKNLTCPVIFLWGRTISSADEGDHVHHFTLFIILIMNKKLPRLWKRQYQMVLVIDHIYILPIFLFFLKYLRFIFPVVWLQVISFKFSKKMAIKMLIDINWFPSVKGQLLIWSRIA